jgi:hypothetical protein
MAQLINLIKKEELIIILLNLLYKFCCYCHLNKIGFNFMQRLFII